jgi:MerR family transcriptional regulator, Zn(II)-responsive regulator of zntA
MRVSEIAELTRTTADTIRFYSRIGYLKPDKDPINGYRIYGGKDAVRMRFILSARHLGFSVNDVGQLLRQASVGESPCPVARDIVKKRLEETEQSFREMSLLRKRLKTAVESWESKPDLTPTGEMICHLIEEFAPMPADSKGEVP